MKIKFLPDNVVWEGEGDKSLAEIAGLAGVSLNTDCGGRGTCGKCKVRVLLGGGVMEQAKREGLAQGTEWGLTQAADKGAAQAEETGAAQAEEPGAAQAEETGLTQAEMEGGIRLACLLRPCSDMTVLVLNQEAGPSEAKSKKDMNRFPGDFKMEAAVKKTVLNVPPPGLTDQRSAAERLTDALQRALADSVTAEDRCENETTRDRCEDEATGDRCENEATRDNCDGESTGGLQLEPDCLYALNRTLSDSEGKVTAVTEGERILSIEPGDTKDLCFGMAFDIGTTTVVGLLWDLTGGRLLDTEARTNPQSVYGADVISRIYYSSQSAENMDRMSGAIGDCFGEIIGAVCIRQGISPENIYRVTVVGNTAMSHLFLGVDASSLARSPFAPVFCHSVERYAKELGIGVHPQAVVRLLPNIAGHVGSDISAGLLSSRLERKKGVNLAVDIGTNGEILLAKGGRVLACSTAAGPAFEGAEIQQGMRAAPGAIQGVRLSQQGVELSVIDGKTPVGICGSGLIDAVAQLFEQGLLSRSGRLMKREKARAAGIPAALAERLCEGRDGYGFLLYRDGEEDHGNRGGLGQDTVILSQKDIRQVQLAKGAILAGIRILMKEMGVGVEDIDSIVLAGAFGNFVRRESVLAIGMLPAVEARRVTSIGNAAGAGASMALLSNLEYRLVKKLAAEAEHVELAAHPDFQNEFVASMGIG